MCNCAERMRNYVLPHTGFRQSEDGTLWTNVRTGEVIADADIDHHHTRLTAEIGLRRIRNFWNTLGGQTDG